MEKRRENKKKEEKRGGGGLVGMILGFNGRQ